MRETILMDPIEIVGQVPPSTDYTSAIIIGSLALAALGFYLVQRLLKRQAQEAEEAFERYQAALREEDEEVRTGGFTPPTGPSKVAPARFESESYKRSYDPEYPPPTYDFAGYDYGASSDSGSDSGSSDCGSSDGGSSSCD
jgi:type II secretory pathway pseudopilin PulG